MSLIESLQHIGERTAIVQGDASVSGRVLADQSDLLADALRDHGRVLVWSDGVEDVVRAIAAMERSGGTLYIAHPTLPAEAVNEVVRVHRISARLHRGDLTPQVDGSSKRGADVELVVMTSGTTGDPKRAAHRLKSIRGTVRRTAAGEKARWLLTYPPTSFAGLQVLLTALIGEGMLVAPSARNPEEFVVAAREHAVTHASGTPTFWRAFLAAAGDTELRMKQVTLGGEAVDQPTLDRIAERIPGARRVHIYATTELGVLFTVVDGRAGFPASWLESSPSDVGLRITDGVLEVNSPRRMQRYVSDHATPLTDDGWFRTGDLIDVVGDRALFAGREDGLLNVGGYKVRPEQVETVLLTHPEVADVRVHGISNPLTGQVVAAEVVAAPGADLTTLKARLLRHGREHLESYKAPRVLRFVDNVGSDFGKKAR